jgi:hypothetical protein
MRCSPFRLQLFATMMYQSVPLSAIAGSPGLQNQYTFRPLAELTAETELLWLIQVGLLRREVDGQGLTDSFRVTPLGRQLAQRWQQFSETECYSPTRRDRFYNALNRWFRLKI